MLKTAFVASTIAIYTALGTCGALAQDKITFEHVMNIGATGTGEGQFKYVEDFAFTKDGNLLATDAVHACVQVFDKTSGKFICRFGGKGDSDAHLVKPEGIAVDPDGNIFIADYNSGFVKKYDASYKWLLTFSEYGSEQGPEHQVGVHGYPRRQALHAGGRQPSRQRVRPQRQIPVRLRRHRHRDRPDEHAGSPRSSPARASSTSPT